MGLLDWILWGAAALVGALVISEVVHYFLDVPSIRQILQQKKMNGELKNGIRCKCKNNDGHKVGWGAFDINDNEVAVVEITSDKGVSSNVKPGMIIDLD